MPTTEATVIHNNIMSLLLEIIPYDSGMTLPPNIFSEMDGQFLEFAENESLVARFPNRENYMNPVRFMQGGIITAAIDNTVSPLSYTLGSPCVTKEITTTFKRPITEADSFIYVTAIFDDISDKSVKLRAFVRNEKGRLAALAHVICIFIKPRNNM